jgi:hypothetical protein
MGFALATHFCGGLAVETALVFGHKTLDCGMPNMDEASKSSEQKETSISKTACCQNEHQSLDLEDNFKPSHIFSTINADFVVAFIFSFFDFPFFATNEKPQFANYLSPLIKQDISVLYQVFQL